MALEYYDDAIAAKLEKWTPSDLKLRILKPEDTKRLFETIADDRKDKNIKLPFLCSCSTSTEYLAPKVFWIDSLIMEEYVDISELDTELNRTAKNSNNKKIISYDESLKFLEKYGFERKAIRKGYYNGIDGILMERTMEEW